MKTVIVASIVILTILVGFPVACQYSEQPRSYYSNYTEDLHNGMWVLDIFPKDIKNINEQHDIDTNEVWLKFTLGTKKIDLSHYQKIDKSDISYSKPFLTTWWFSDLPPHYNFYRGSCEGSINSSTLALSTKSKEVYWWCS